MTYRLLPFVVAAALSCRATEAAPPSPSDARPRTFRMGFSPFPPRPANETVVAALEAWSRRADAAILHQGVPYRALLSGTSATAAVTANELQAVNYFRSKHLAVYVTVDVTDGLNRGAESPELVALGRSIREPAVQQAYRDYVRALVAIVKPDYPGLAAETNLIRLQAPADVYAALVQMTNAAATDVRGMPAPRPVLYASVQADVAWGWPQGGGYQGVERDFRDFPFIEALGISSYPYFVYGDPEAIPLDYYARLPNGRPIPVLVVEGGWTSETVGAVRSSPAAQARYVRRQERLLDSARAIAWLQLNFTDIDVAAFPTLPAGSIVPLFARLGLVDAALRPKPALAVYDSVYARRHPAP